MLERIAAMLVKLAKSQQTGAGAEEPERVPGD